MKTTITLKLFPLVALTAVSGVIVAQPAQAIQPTPPGFHAANAIMAKPPMPRPQFEQHATAGFHVAPPPAHHQQEAAEKVTRVAPPPAPRAQEAREKARVAAQLVAPRRQEAVAGTKLTAAKMLTAQGPKTNALVGQATAANLLTAQVPKTTAVVRNPLDPANQVPRDPFTGRPYFDGDPQGGQQDPAKQFSDFVKGAVTVWTAIKTAAAQFPGHTVIGEFGREKYGQAVRDLGNDIKAGADRAGPDFKDAGKAIQKGDVGKAVADVAKGVGDFFGGLFKGHA